jgi:hypothetical protein
VEWEGDHYLPVSQPARINELLRQSAITVCEAEPAFESAEWVQAPV